MTTKTSKPVILVVDDDQSTRYLMQECLSDLGEVVVLSSAESAYEYLSANRPADLMILDIVMEGMNGIELLKRIGSDERDMVLPCLIYTAFNNPDMERLAFEAGATDFIEKPISFARLQMRVRAHLKSKQLYDQVAEAASIDHLCGVLNRQAFLKRLSDELKRAARVPYKIALLMLDLDNFKALNDTLGHASGDRALIRVSNVLTSCFSRTGESVGRFAGDEFLAATFGLDENALVRSAEFMLQSIAAIDERVDGQKLGISCSVGMVVMDFSYCQAMTDREGALLQWMLSRADELMYRAKRSGRNQLCHELHYFSGEKTWSKDELVS